MEEYCARNKIARSGSHLTLICNGNESTEASKNIFPAALYTKVDSSNGRHSSVSCKDNAKILNSSIFTDQKYHFPDQFLLCQKIINLTSITNNNEYCQPKVVHGLLQIGELY